MPLRFLAALGLLLSTSLHAASPSYITFPSDIDWVTRNSPHFEIIYRRGQDAYAERTLRAAERAHKLLTPIFPPGPESTYIVLADFHDSTNGYALNFPYPHIVVFAAPPDPTGTLSSLDSWLESVVLHEYVHILHIYPAQGLWKTLRSIFGTIMVPNGLMPKHMHEGLATFLETEFSQGGRGRGSQFAMYRRIAVEEGVWGKEFVPLDRLDGSGPFWPGGVSPYFFGYQLYQELWSRKKDKGIYRFTDSSSDNWPYLLDRPLLDVYGLNYDELWPMIFDKTRLEAQKEIDAIKKTPLSPLRYRTETRFSKWDLVLSPDGKKLAYKAGSPSKGTGIEIVDSQTFKPLDRMPLGPSRASGICWGKQGSDEWLVFLDEQSRLNYSLNFLYAYNPSSGERLRLELPRGGWNHLHALGCSSDLKRLVVYREIAGQGAIKELAWNATQEKLRGQPVATRQWVIPSGTVVTGIAVADTVWFLLRRGPGTELWRWDPKADPGKVLELPNNVYGIEAEGNEIRVVADIDGRDEVWLVDPRTKSLQKLVSLLGGVSGFASRGNHLFLSSYRHGGYDIAETDLSTTAKRRAPTVPVAKLAKRKRRVAAETDPTAAPDFKITPVRDYSPLGSLYPRTWLPSALIVPDGVQIAVFVPGFDVAQRHYYTLLGGYDTRGLPFTQLSHSYRFGGNYQLDSSLYYFPNYIQLFRAFQRTYGGSIGISTVLPLGDWFAPNLSLSLLYRMNEASNLGPSNLSVGAGVAVSQSLFFRTRPQAIAPVLGTKVTLSHSQYFKTLGSTDNYYLTQAKLEQYLENPVWEGHVLYGAAKMGYTYGTALNVAYFAGGGELQFDSGRGNYLNRGFLPGLFLSQRMVNFTLEYRFPIAQIYRGIGLKPIYLKQIHGAFVADTISLGQRWFDVYFASAGFELKTELDIGFYVPASVRLGGYHGFGRFGESLYFTVGLDAAI